jgi:hypothetical protein
VLVAPAQFTSLAAALVLAKRPCAVISDEAQYKLVVVEVPITALAAVEPVKATKVSIKMLTI